MTNELQIEARASRTKVGKQDLEAGVGVVESCNDSVPLLGRHRNRRAIRMGCKSAFIFILFAPLMLMLLSSSRKTGKPLVRVATVLSQLVGGNLQKL